jgi:predicted porin
VTQLSRSGYNSSRLGFRGTEDLGGGLSASFWLEGDLNNDDGRAGGTIAAGNQGNTVTRGSGFNFNRRSTVSLAGGWGELRIGRDYTPSFWNLTVFDPFGTNGVGTTLGLVGAGLLNGAVTVRASNDIGYFAPANLGGFYGQINYWMGENVRNGAATEKDGTGYGLRVGYAAGPFNVAGAYAKTRYAAGDFRTWNLGGQWDFGIARIMAQFGKDRVTAPTNVDGRQWLLGFSVPVGPGEIRGSYSTYRVDLNAGVPNPRANQFALGYVHNLSKRTALYATIARVKNRDGAAVTLGGATPGAGNFSSSGYDLGIRHSF